MEKNRYNGSEFRSARETGNRPEWLTGVLALPRADVERGGRTYTTIDAILASPRMNRVRRGLNGHGPKAVSLFHKAIERHAAVGLENVGFSQDVIESSIPGVPAIIAVQDRDPNPNARTRAYYSVSDGVYILRAVSGVDRKDEKAIMDEFKAEGYRTDLKRTFSVTPGRE